MAMPVKHIDKDRFMVMWNAGDSHLAMAAAFGVSDNTIERRAREWGLPPRFRQHRGAAPIKPPTQHIAAVLMPAEPLEARADWPDLKAAVQRANGRPGPQAALAMIATRFRLPVAVVQGLAGRLWASHEATVARDARDRADVDQVRSR